MRIVIFGTGGIGSLYGVMVRIGEKLGVLTHPFLYHFLLPQEQQARGNGGTG